MKSQLNFVDATQGLVKDNEGDLPMVAMIPTQAHVELFV